MRKLGLILLIVLSLTLALTACADPCTAHVDADDNGMCDKCDKCIEHLDEDLDNFCDRCRACIEHYDGTGDGKCDICQSDMPCTEHTDGDKDGKCDTCDATMPCETHKDAALDGKCDVCEAEITLTTIEDALDICAKLPNKQTSEERYYIRATVAALKDPAYGKMLLRDSTGEISVWGTYSIDGALPFSEMTDKPSKGDEVILHCILKNFNDSYEVNNARVVGYIDVPFDESKYTEATVAEVRAAEKDDKITVEGVVARITYSAGVNPAGFILVDGTQSIYVYDEGAARSVEIGNSVKIAGVKDYWILDTEKSAAEKFGYGGCNQITDVYLLENDGKKNTVPTSWVPESTVMDIMKTPITEDITTSLYKVTAIIKKVPGQGFINYYINDLDESTGTYVYTQANGNDLTWLDPLDGKVCTVYVTALNAKSTQTGCLFRFLPVMAEEIKDFSFPASDVPAHVLEYYGMKQFLTSYTGDPGLELDKFISSTLLGFENATLSYQSSNTEVITFTDGADKVTMTCPGYGTATVTISASYNGKSVSDTITVTVTEPPKYQYVSVSEAISSEKGATVNVKGIVGASLINKVGFYLIDETGAIAVQLNDSAIFKTVSIGDEVIITGTRAANDSGTQIYIDGATVLANFYGDNAYPTSSFSASTITEAMASTDTAKVYVLNAKITKFVQGYATVYSVVDPTDSTKYLQVYSSNGAGLGWLDDYLNTEISVELAICNWNGRGYKAAILSITVGTEKIVNSDGFIKYGA